MKIRTIIYTVNRFIASRFLLLMILLCAETVPVTAQKNAKFIVYSITGNIQTEGRPLRLKQQIQSSQYITLGKESQITLLDVGNQLLYCLHKEGHYKVSDYIKEMNPSFLKLSVNFMRYIKNQFLGLQENDNKTSLQRIITGGYRGDEEYIWFINTLWSYFPIPDSASLQELLMTREPFPTGEYAVDFEFVSHKDHSVLQGLNDIQNPYYIRVTNHAEVPLFVNILNIDSLLNMVLLINPNEVTGASAIVPAKSMVSFTQDIISLDASSETEYFILFATPFPLDLSFLEEEIDTNRLPTIFKKQEEMKIGLQRKRIATQPPY